MYASPSDRPPSPDLLTRQLEAAVARGDTPGVVALVTSGGGVEYEGAAGELRVRATAMVPDAIFRIASMTKPLTSVAVMQLIEEGKLGLDDPVATYLEGFETLRVMSTLREDGTYLTRSSQKALTIRHLLTHTSGFGYGLSSPIVARLLEGTQKTALDLPLLHEPGARWTYGAGTRLLGRIIESVTGMSLECRCQERLFQPLGMLDTSWAVEARKQPRLAAVHVREQGRWQPRAHEDPVPTAPSAPFKGDDGLYSTARDYGCLIRMFLNGGQSGPHRLLSERTVRLMGENHIGSSFVEEQRAQDATLAQPFPLGAGRDRFGLGFQIAADSDAAAGYRSAGSLSWTGMYNTAFWIDPRRNLGAVLLMQTLPFHDTGAVRAWRAFEAAVYESGDRR